MNERGVRTWWQRILNAGDWAEVEPLNCHFAAWLDREGLGTVIKAAGSGKLAGVGRIGVSGKTVCTWRGSDGREQHCSNHGSRARPPAMRVLMAEYRKEFAERGYALIAKTSKLRNSFHRELVRPRADQALCDTSCRFDLRVRPG